MKPFLHGRKANSTQALHAPAHPSGTPPVSRPHSPSHGGTGSHVEVVKQGDKVVRLIVTCGCGERTEVECIYPGSA